MNKVWHIAAAGILALGLRVEASQRSEGWPTPAAPAAEPPSTPTPAPKQTVRVRTSASRPRPPISPVAPPAAIPGAATSVAPAASPAPSVIPPPEVVPPPIAGSADATLAATAEVVQLLQQQTTLLATLSSEVERQRRVIAEQQVLIAAIEHKAAAAVTQARPLPALTVDTSGASKLRFGGLLQGQFTTGTGAIDTFRLRRSELKLSGELTSRARWSMMIDPAKALAVANNYVTLDGQKVVADTAVNQNARFLQDAVLSYAVSPNLTFELGQQRITLGYEGSLSSSRLDTIERALYMSDRSRGGTFGDIRDVGVIARGKAMTGRVEYFASLVNGLGESQNDVDKNRDKAFAARAVYKPAAMAGLQFGGSFARGAFQPQATARRERLGIEALFSRPTYTFRFEAVRGRDGAVERAGYYTQLTYKVRKTLDAVFRSDVFDPDTNSDATPAVATERDWLGGVNYQLVPSTFVLQFNYVRKTFAAGASRHVALANLQTSW